MFVLPSVTHDVSSFESFTKEICLLSAPILRRVIYAQLLFGKNHFLCPIHAFCVKMQHLVSWNKKNRLWSRSTIVLQNFLSRFNLFQSIENRFSLPAPLKIMLCLDISKYSINVLKCYSQNGKKKLATLWRSARESAWWHWTRCCGVQCRLKPIVKMLSECFGV